MATQGYKAAPPGLLARPRKLSQAIAERIAGDIRRRKLRPGAKLPTEQQLAASLGVSRTVVREAVAALASQGLVETRQGVGAFVAPEDARRHFRLVEGALPSLEAVLQVMELRAAVEVLAAGLAAARGTSAARRRVSRALGRIDRAIRRGESAIEEDFQFHRAIAEATGNPQFVGFLEFLGHYIIPRQSVRVAMDGPRAERDYLETIQSEHRAICDAILAGDVEKARQAMRMHLEHSQERYRRYASNSPGALAP